MEKENIEKEVKSNEVKNGDAIKDNAKETYKEVKENVKNININQDTKEVKNLVISIIDNPIGLIKNVAKDTAKNLRAALMTIIIWTVVIVFISLWFSISSLGFEFYISYILDNLISLVKLMVGPALGIIALSIGAFYILKIPKKRIIDYVTLITIAKIPLMVYAILGLLTIISTKINTILSPMGTILSSISIILIYFGLKNMQEEQDTDEKFIIKFIMIMVVFSIIEIGIGYLGIYIY